MVLPRERVMPAWNESEYAILMLGSNPAIDWLTFVGIGYDGVGLNAAGSRFALRNNSGTPAGVRFPSPSLRVVEIVMPGLLLKIAVRSPSAGRVTARA